MSGEPYALRGARTVRRGEAGKQLDCAPSLTLLKAPVRGMYYYLYMIVDIYSRCIVGWEVHEEDGKPGETEPPSRSSRATGALCESHSPRSLRATRRAGWSRSRNAS